MLQDALLAYLHFGLILILAGILFSEVALSRRQMERASFTLLARLDIWYGAMAGCVLASGVSRVLWGAKGAEFYIHNPVFWIKVGLFLVVALLSIPPTIHYLQVARAQPGSGAVAIDPQVFQRMRALLVAEVVILLILPLLAALMARGI